MSASEVISVALRRYLEGELAEHGPKTSANAWPESCRVLGWSSPRSRGAGGSLGMTAQSSPQRHQIAPSTPPAPCSAQTPSCVLGVGDTALFPRALIPVAPLCTDFPLLRDRGLQTPLWVISQSPANEGTSQLPLAPPHLLVGETPCPRAAVPGLLQAQSTDKCRSAARPHPQSHLLVICTAWDRQQGVRGLPGLPGTVSTIKTSPSSCT